MIFASSGHCNQPGPNLDSGAVGVNGRWEANETVRVRNRVVDFINAKGNAVVSTDNDNESLSQYLNRIQTGTSSVVCEFHFNASANPEATGVETVVEEDADRLDKAAANEINLAISRTLGIRNRGVKLESETPRKRLGLMRENGIVVLPEICFISNPDDMRAYDANFDAMCEAIADILIKYENLIP